MALILGKLNSLLQKQGEDSEYREARAENGNGGGPAYEHREGEFRLGGMTRRIEMPIFEGTNLDGFVLSNFLP